MSMQTILLSLSTITDEIMNVESRVHGAPNPSLLEDHGLTIDYPPVDFINAFTRRINCKKNFRDKTPYILSVETMCLWSNEKEGLMGMGGSKFTRSFKKFPSTSLKII